MNSEYRYNVEGTVPDCVLRSQSVFGRLRALAPAPDLKMDLTTDLTTTKNPNFSNLVRPRLDI